MSDEEFDEESFQAYENELYEEQSDSDNEIESDIEETLYSQVHYSFSLPEDDQPEDDEDGELASNTENRPSSPTIINLIEESACSASSTVITISDDDDVNNRGENDDDENDNHDSISETSPGAQENWDLIDKDLEDGMTGKSKRGPNRYYIGENRNSNIRCRNCNERGHIARDCSEPKKITSCSLCGTSGHMKRACPNELCFNCYEPGHRSFKCPHSRIRWGDKCRRCFQTGHHSYLCPDLWRQYHRTTVAGTPPIADRTKEFTGPVYCSNCSAKGHYGHECIEDRPGLDRSCYFQFIVRYDGENRSTVDNERLNNRKRKHEQETDIPVNQQQSKKNKQQNKQQQQQQQHHHQDDSNRRKSWPRQSKHEDINVGVTSNEQSKSKNNRKKSWPIENKPEHEDLIPVKKKRGPKKSKRKSYKKQEKREAKNAKKIQQDNNEDLVMQLNAHHSERSVTIRPETDYNDRDQPDDHTFRRNVEFKDARDSRLSDSLKKIVDDWGEIHEKRKSGNRNSSPGSSRKGQYSSPDSTRNDRYSSRGFWQHDDLSPSDDRLLPAFMNKEDRYQPDPRDLPSLLDVEFHPRNENNQTQSKRKKKFRSFQNSSFNDSHSFPGSDYNDLNSLPGPNSRGQYSHSSPGPSHHNRDYFPGPRNPKWPKKNKSRNTERGFRSKKKNFTM